MLIQVSENNITSCKSGYNKIQMAFDIVYAMVFCIKLHSPFTASEVTYIRSSITHATSRKVSSGVIVAS